MTVGDLRKIIAGLDNDTELEIKDEATEETYDIYEVDAIAYSDSAHNGVLRKRSRLQFVTNVELQTGRYSMDKSSR